MNIFFMSTGLLFIIGFVFFPFVVTYKKLKDFQKTSRFFWTDIESQLKKIYMLTPELAEMIKIHVHDETDIFENFNESRLIAMHSLSPTDKATFHYIFKEAFQRLLQAAENCPELKVNVNFLKLQRELMKLEDNLESTIIRYNNIVRDYNTRIDSFPSNIIAAQFRLEKEERFEHLTSEQQQDAIKLLDNDICMPSIQSLGTTAEPIE